METNPVFIAAFVFKVIKDNFVENGVSPSPGKVGLDQSEQLLPEGGTRYRYRHADKECLMLADHDLELSAAKYCYVRLNDDTVATIATCSSDLSTSRSSGEGQDSVCPSSSYA